jgi:hypothetical protein
MKSSYTETLKQATPTGEKTGFKLTIRGKSIGTAVFRAELKKELTFFRGCSADYQISRRGDEGTLIAEGKTIAIAKFLDWLRALELPQVERKPNFQGPPTEILVASGVWQPFGGKIKGFSAGTEPPLEGSHLIEDGKKEAASMAGTDESV